MRRAGGALVLAGVIGGAAIALGQTSAGGSLTGTVVDPSCGVLPGATVTARQLDGELARTAVTSNNGRFTVDGLPAGDYALTASLAGFGAASRRSIYLRAAETISSSLVLELGSSRSSIRANCLVPREPGLPRICVPVEMSRSVLLVRATLNDAPEPVWLILDSGASVSVVGEALATARGITARAIGETRAGIGESSTRIGMIGRVTVHVAGAEIATNNTVSLPLGDDFDVIGHQVDGVLGSDVFLKYVVRIDYAAASVTLFDANSFAYDGTGTTIPIALSGNTPNVNVTVETGGTSLSAGALLDTGSDGSIGFTRPFVDTHHLLEGRMTVPGFGMGVGGEASVILGRVDALRLGPFSFPRPVVGFSRATQGATASDAREGIMGAEVLRRFTVTLDYPHRRVILEPNARLGDPFDADMSGIVLAKNSRGVVRVLAVRPDTPAAQLGIRAGDEIASIDGRAATALPLDTISRWFRIPDRDYRLALGRAGQAVEVVLHTKRLI